MHHVAWVIAPLVLVGVLALSAAAKAGKGDSLRSIIANLHLPAWVLPPRLARSIPYLELALVVGLLTPWVPVFAGAATATLLLMLIYWALIARGLTITPRPSCGCFGDVDQPISRRTLVRNTLLVAAAAAALALAVSGRTVWTVLSGAGTADWLWLGLAALACAVTALVLGSKAEGAAPIVWQEATTDAATQPLAAGEEQQEDGDYVRAPIPELLLHDPSSGPVTLIELSATRAQLLVFVNCYCASTTAVATLIEGWQEQLGHADLHLVFSVPIAGRFVGDVPPGTLVDHAGLTWQQLELEESPSAMLLGVDGYLAGGPVQGQEEVREFVDEVIEVLREVAPTEEDVSVSQGQLTGDR